VVIENTNKTGTVKEDTSMPSDRISTNISGVTLYKQSSVRIAANKIIYVDP